MRTIMFIFVTIGAYIWLNKKNGYMEIFLSNIKGFDPSTILENIGNTLKELISAFAGK